jgi:hypothetical protein
MILTGKPSIRKNLPLCHFVNHKSHMDLSGIKPVSPRWDKWRVFSHFLHASHSTCASITMNYTLNRKSLYTVKEILLPLKTVQRTLKRKKQVRVPECPSSYRLSLSNFIHPVKGITKRSSISNDTIFSVPFLIPVISNMDDFPHSRRQFSNPVGACARHRIKSTCTMHNLT